MAILKKVKLNNRVKASTLMETLVATIVIVIVFVMASMILNNLFSNTIKNNTRAIKAHLNELQYLQQHHQLQLPYQDTYKDWNITIERFSEKNQNVIAFEATNIKTKKTISINLDETN